jgi:DNA-nicking Smr family endonuclease
MPRVSSLKNQKIKSRLKQRKRRSSAAQSAKSAAKQPASVNALTPETESKDNSLQEYTTQKTANMTHKKRRRRQKPAPPST